MVVNHLIQYLQYSELLFLTTKDLLPSSKSQLEECVFLIAEESNAVKL